jgi:polyphenol oxidase
VLENTLNAVVRAANCDPADVLAWLGPCIGPRAFEVGDEVREAFGAASHQHFASHVRLDGSAAWLADLPAVARQRLGNLGVRDISGGRWCTVEDPSAFFSHRRDRRTGRLAAAVGLIR